MQMIWQSLLSLAAAGCMMFSGPVDAAAPQHDADGLLFLANRQWRMSKNYVPETRVTNVIGQVRELRPDASLALEEMYAACEAEIGVKLTSVSGYRSYGKQSKIYQNKLERVNGSKKRADEYVARPGASEHQLALAMDVGQKNETSLQESFGKTEGGAWVRDNCWRFGFILRYQEGWEEITGYSFEPWHVRYVGKENAAKIHQANMPLETYLEKTRGETLLAIVTGEILED